jgi:hypothetical protein
MVRASLRANRLLAGSMQLDWEHARAACSRRRPGGDSKSRTFSRPNSERKMVDEHVRRDADHRTPEACAPHLNLGKLRC